MLVVANLGPNLVSIPYPALSIKLFFHNSFIEM